MDSFTYTLIRSSRKTISIQVTPEGAVVVRCPRRMKEAEIQRFLSEKSPWIEKHLTIIAARPRLPKFTPEELQSLALQAKETLPPRVALFARQMGVTYGRITIRSQHSRWGSCSAKGNLNFNCLLMLTSPEIRDYVIVHELCHRKHMNHSAAFWAEVEKILPDYRTPKKWLKENGNTLIARLP